MAWRLGQDIAEGSYVNLGVGIPLLVLDHGAGLCLRDHLPNSENGVLGMKPKDETDGIRPDDLTNAGTAAGLRWCPAPPCFTTRTASS